MFHAPHSLGKQGIALSAVAIACLAYPKAHSSAFDTKKPQPSTEAASPQCALHYILGVI